jgi:hypothetical protein
MVSCVFEDLRKRKAPNRKQGWTMLRTTTTTFASTNNFELRTTQDQEGETNEDMPTKIMAKVLRHRHGLVIHLWDLGPSWSMPKINGCHENTLLDVLLPSHHLWKAINYTQDLRPYLGEEDEMPSRTTPIQDRGTMRTSLHMMLILMCFRGL